MRVVVIGGGVVGLCPALELSRGGADVVVVEREPTHRGSSVANAGWVVPVMSAPLAAPGVVGTVAGRLFSAGSSLRVAPRPSLLRWCASFLRHTTTERHLAGVEALLALGAGSVELFDELRADGLEFETYREGLLLVARTETGVAEAARLAERSTAAGYLGTVDVYNGPGVRRLEPALSERVVGGVHAPSEIHLRSETVVPALLAALRRNGVAVRQGVDVRGVERAEGARWSVVTGTGSLAADRVVVAAGSWSNRLLRGLGVRIALAPGKGYVLTSGGEGISPRHPMKLMEDNVACTPLDGALRLSGMFELGAHSWTVPRRAVAQILNGAGRYLRDRRANWDCEVTAGFRPATPDSLPIIGPVPGSDGVFVATGHGMLGLTLAPATARLLAPLVLRNEHAPELAPFGVERFANPASSRPPVRSR